MTNWMGRFQKIGFEKLGIIALKLVPVVLNKETKVKTA